MSFYNENTLATTVFGTLNDLKSKEEGLFDTLIRRKPSVAAPATTHFQNL